MLWWQIACYSQLRLKSTRRITASAFHWLELYVATLDGSVGMLLRRSDVTSNDKTVVCGKWQTVAITDYVLAALA